MREERLTSCSARSDAGGAYEPWQGLAYVPLRAEQLIMTHELRRREMEVSALRGALHEREVRLAALLREAGELRAGRQADSPCSAAALLDKHSGLDDDVQLVQLLAREPQQQLHSPAQRQHSGAASQPAAQDAPPVPAPASATLCTASSSAALSDRINWHPSDGGLSARVDGSPDRLARQFASELSALRAEHAQLWAQRARERQSAAGLRDEVRSLREGRSADAVELTRVRAELCANAHGLQAAARELHAALRAVELRHTAQAAVAAVRHPSLELSADERAELEQLRSAAAGGALALESRGCMPGTQQHGAGHEPRHVDDAAREAEEFVCGGALEAGVAEAQSMADELCARARAAERRPADGAERDACREGARADEAPCEAGVARAKLAAIQSALRWNDAGAGGTRPGARRASTDARAPAPGSARETQTEPLLAHLGVRFTPCARCSLEPRGRELPVAAGAAGLSWRMLGGVSAWRGLGAHCRRAGTGSIDACATSVSLAVLGVD
ncbi:hypothetical protein KFE25_002976 [Diacronema lutheri]|uniref:Uncharacterized protein n=1 Tax=Diacronema lutheri TaxID=2081491 RepID=A0A8J6CAM3_DIALT|nr:hypothetical protein KFE25_002976 [Diacronema lutheri]